MSLPIAKHQDSNLIVFFGHACTVTPARRMVRLKQRQIGLGSRRSRAVAFTTCFLALSTAETITFNAEPAYKEVRSCVRNCLDYNGGLWQGIGCDNNDGCICNAVYRPSASSFLESCVETYYTTCTDGYDYTVAANIYDSYCGFTAADTVVITPTATAKATLNAPVTVTMFTSYPTVTVTTSSSSSPISPSSSFSEWSLVAAAVSLALLVNSI